MSMQKFTIKGRLDGLNEYTFSNRLNRYSGYRSKLKNEKIVRTYIKASGLKKVTKYPVGLNITWYEKNSKRDIDNITFAKKFILDALVKEGILESDSQRCVIYLEDTVLIDKSNPRIEVKIYD